MAQELNLENTAYAPGVYEFVIDNVPVTRDQMEFVMTRGNGVWPGTRDDLVVAIAIQASLSNGAPFQLVATGGWMGGQATNKDGTQRFEERVRWSWPGEADGQGGRRAIKPDAVKIIMEIFQTLETEITLHAIKFDGTKSQAQRL